MSTTPPEKPAALGMKEQLDAMTATLATIDQRQRQQADMGLLLADCRDTITEAVGVMHSQGADILHRLEALARQKPHLHWLHSTQRWWALGVGVVTVVSGAYIWTGQRAYQREQHGQALAAIHTVLETHYKALPAGLQVALLETYARHGIRPPGQERKR